MALPAAREEPFFLSNGFAEANSSGLMKAPRCLLVSPADEGARIGGKTKICTIDRLFSMRKALEFHA